MAQTYDSGSDMGGSAGPNNAFTDDEMLRLLQGQGQGQGQGQAQGMGLERPAGASQGSAKPPSSGDARMTVAQPAPAATDTALPGRPAPMPPTAPTTPAAYQPGPTMTDPGPTQAPPPVRGGTNFETDPTAGPDSSGDWASKDYSNPENVRAYFQSRGVTPSESSVNYWAQKYNSPEFNHDRGYFFQRLGQADEFGGGGGMGSGRASIPSTPYTSDPMISDAIKRLLARGEAMPSGSDPAIRAQFNPQAQISQQGAARAKASAAERAFGSGQVGAGANDLASGQIDIAEGQNEASLMGSLIGNELQARRQDVIQALSMAQGEERMALQQYLANIDAQLRNQGLGNQQQQFYDDLGNRIGQFASLQNQY